MCVTELASNEKFEWDEFVLHNECGLPFHLYAWQEVLKGSYGYPFWHLVIKQGGQIVGGLQLFKVKSMLVGTSLSSMPGGICTQQVEAAQELLDYAKVLADQQGATSLVVRDSRKMWSEASQWQSTCSIAVRRLPSDIDSLRGQLKRQVKQHLRKAETFEVTTAVGSDYLEEFYTTVSKLLHEKGVPVYSRKFLSCVADRLKGHYVITVAFIKGKAIGGIFEFKIRDTLFAVWGGVPSSYLDTHSSYALWWAMMQYGVENGYKTLDMGRSQRCSGVEEFKSRWGSEMYPSYDYQLIMGRAPFFDPIAERCGGSKMQVFTNIWRQAPDSFVQTASPWLRWHVPFI